ncbi:MAG TPA: CAP domain-containing protein [Roseiflexaceae bacterium]|nr:CAP domain-containing protein [Roseiflexaceae bacterium]
MGRTQHVLLCTLCMCIAALMPALTLADERPSDKPNTVFLPLALQERDGTTVSSNPPPAAPTTPVTPTEPTPVTPTPTDPAPTPSPVVLTPQEADLVRLVNALRAQKNLPALNVSPELTAAARAHSQDMADNNYFDDIGSDKSQPWDRMKAAGYPLKEAGESIMGGPDNAQEVVNFWKNDTKHLANILNPAYKDIGVGFVNDPNDVWPLPSGGTIMGYDNYWTMDVGVLP